MKKWIWPAAIVFALALSVLPALAGVTTCGQSFDVVEGQKVTLTAKPDTPLLTDWMYLWTGVDGLPGTQHDHVAYYTAPAYDPATGATNCYPVTLTTSNTHTAASCSNLCTITFCVKPKVCPLPGADVCRTDNGDGTYTYPSTDLSYTGLTHDYYTYHWEATMNDASIKVLKAALNDPTYTLDWTQLDQPSSTVVEECTTLKFYITTPGSTTHLQECTGVYCLSYDPTADIDVVT